MIRICLLFVISSFWATSVLAEEKADQNGITNSAVEEIKQYTNKQALDISQAAIGNTIGHYRFTSTTGEVISNKVFRGKPLIVSLIYTSCYHICPTTTENLNRVVEKARDVLGEESFNVVTIGFDTHQDTPEAMAAFASMHSSKPDNWHFLSTDPATMTALVRDLGFIYTPSPQGFDHLIQASIIDKEGVIYRQVYGIRPQTPNFVEPIKELVFGEAKEASFFDAISLKVNLFCTVYDPARDQYYFNYSIFVGVFVGVIMCLFFLRIFIREWRLSNSKYNK